MDKLFQGPHIQISVLTQALESDGNLMTALITENLNCLQFGRVAR